MSSISSEELLKFESLAKEIRRDIVEMLYRTKSHHIGGSLSMVELLVSLYFKVLLVHPEKPDDPERDKFILSKGHGCPALFAVLAKKGFISKEDMSTFAQDGGALQQHPDKDISKGIELTSGSLGYGLSVGNGIALAGKYDSEDYRVFVYLGDGELNEGSNWESIAFAAHHKLDNLVAIVDYNKLQAAGTEEEVMNLKPLKDKWASFGWSVKEVDGHNFKEILEAFGTIPFEKGKPSCLIANTVKGKGISFMENIVKWHDKCVEDNEYEKALKELE